jgi:hypothetical protein
VQGLGLKIFQEVTELGEQIGRFQPFAGVGVKLGFKNQGLVLNIFQIFCKRDPP